MKEKYKEIKKLQPSWELVELLHEDYLKMSCKPSKKKLPENHVEDEDRSVKWNREFIKKHNDEVEEEVKRLNQHKNAARTRITHMVHYLIHEELEWKFTEEDVVRMYNCWDKLKNSYDNYDMQRDFCVLCNIIQEECLNITQMDFFKKMKSKKGVL